VAILRQDGRVSRIAQRQEWKFFAALSKAAPGLAALWWVAQVLRGALPSLLAIAMGLLVGAAPRGAPLAFVGVSFVLLQADRRRPHRPTCRRSQPPAARMRKCGEGGGRSWSWIDQLMASTFGSD
jgi:hypothetical protein